MNQAEVLHNLCCTWWRGGIPLRSLITLGEEAEDRVPSAQPLQLPPPVLETLVAMSYQGQSLVL